MAPGVHLFEHDTSAEIILMKREKEIVS
jgi:hypothetical protein